jgi:hypothetical protein
MRGLLALAILATAAAAPAQPQVPGPFNSGNQFLRLCPTEAWRMLCKTYTIGFAEGVLPNANVPVCTPEGVDIGQMYEVAIKFIRDNPERAHMKTRHLLTMAWAQAWPCEKRPVK